jgi:RND superfamily putative drug exporter
MKRARRRPPIPSGGGPLARIADLATRRPWLIVGIWAVAVGGLTLLGAGIERKLTVHPSYVPGTQSSRAHEIATREFGDDNPLIVMVRGPREQVERQGRTLAARLGRLAGVQVLSPWTVGVGVRGLRPSPNAAALVLRDEGGSADVTALVGPVRREVDRTVNGPVRASLAGLGVTIEAIRGASEQAGRVGELIAIPVLILVLLLVFRSVVAALLPVLVGGTVVAATRGVLDLLLGAVQLDLFAVGVVGMMGLALGIDYSLLVVSRFREERRRGDLPQAVAATLSASVRSIVPAGSALILAMIASSLVIPGAIVHSIAIVIISVTALSMVSAVCVVPALLALIGDNLDRWSLPERRLTRLSPLTWSRRLAGQPRAVVMILAVMLFLAGWAFTLKTGTGEIALLPSGDRSRIEQEEVAKTLGPGWLAPMEVVVDGRGSPVTSRHRLAELASFQRRIEADPGVDSVTGLVAVDRAARRMSGVERGLREQERGLNRLEGGLARAHHGASLASAGLLDAATGAGRLDAGLGAAHDGAGALSGALDATGEGSTRLAQGLGRAGEGSGRLSQGTGKASKGAALLAAGLRKARKQTGAVQHSAGLFESAMSAGNERIDELDSPLHAAEERLADSWQALRRMSIGREDPEYAAALEAVEEASRELTGKDIGSGEQADPSYDGINAGLERAAGQFDVGSYLAARLARTGKRAGKGMTKLERGSASLDRGLRRLTSASRRLADGVAALSQGGNRLAPALRRLGEGAEHLTGGLGLLASGAGQLDEGLGSGARRSKLLSGGLGRMEAGLARQRGSGAGGGGLEQLQRRSPGLFRSSYFVLAGLDGSRPRQRQQMAFLINVDHGGDDARMLVIPTDEPSSAAGKQAKERLDRDAEVLGRRTGTEAVVGGAAPFAIDLNHTLRRETPPLRLILSLISMLILIPVLRSLTVPVIAALINALTVSASFGLLAIFFNGSILGGPGYVESSVLLATMMIMFGLAIDYEVFVFARIREEYVKTGSTDVAVRRGLDRTAHIVTGAAAIMIAVFLAFSVLPYASFRNFGVAQATGVFIDAFIVRLIIIPALMGWLGDASWWMPHWLDRLLPGGNPS